MKEQGFKKVGAGEANGQTCTIWEGDRKTARGTRHEKLWHPDAAGDEMKFINQAPSMGAGTVTVTWKRVKEGQATASAAQPK